MKKLLKQMVTRVNSWRDAAVKHIPDVRPMAFRAKDSEGDSTAAVGEEGGLSDHLQLLVQRTKSANPVPALVARGSYRDRRTHRESVQRTKESWGL